VALVVSNQRKRGCHRDGLGHASGLQLEIDSNLLAHFQQDILALDSPKAHRLGAYRIRPGNQVGSVVFAGFVGGQRSGDASLHVRHNHRCARYYTTTLVRDVSQNAARVALCKHGPPTRNARMFAAARTILWNRKEVMFALLLNELDLIRRGFPINLDPISACLCRLSPNSAVLTYITG